MKRWPLNKAYSWETAPFLRLLPPLVAGIVLYSGNVAEYVAWIVSAAIFSFIVFVGTSFVRRQTDFTRAIIFFSLQFSLFFTAWLSCYYNDVRNDRDWMGESINTADAYVARLVQAPAEKEKTWKLEVDVTNAVDSDRVTSANGRAFVYVYKYDAPALKEGDALVLPNKWQRISNRGNPYEFDYATYCARNNIYYQQFISGRDIVIHQYADEHSLPWIRRVHHWCVRQLEWHITDRATLGLLKAMLFDDRDMLDGELTEAYAQTGIVHIIAISGGHITIFFVLVAFLLGWIRHKKYRWVKYIAAIPLIWIYVVVAGAPPSAVRAATMFSILGIGFALQKTPNGINQLLAAAFLLLVTEPMWLYSIGFQLSFVAVLSIMLFYRPVYKWWSPVNKIARMLWGAVAVSVAAEILVAPLVIYYFHLFPLQFIIANVLAYLFMGVILVLGMLLIAMSSIYHVAHLIAEVTTILSSWFNRLVYALQHLNFDSLHQLTLTELQLVLVYVVISGITIFILKKSKPAFFAAGIALVLFIASVCFVYVRILQQEMLIVYNISKDNRIELITGTTATVLDGKDSVNVATRNFVLEPAHINLHINEERKSEKDNLVRVADKTVFILNQPVKDTLIPADVVILNSKYADMAEIKRVFQPGVLVIPAKLSKGKAENISMEAGQQGIRVHDVGNDGAYILSK
ncbi:MAG: ComEC family competence protein [Taibaiella sp.]|nr:ComEC family competence protein [Taibaiella sp.]